jgi:phosphatidylethanolamine-binding protein (PEBP) family uncharacterized protein
MPVYSMALEDAKAYVCPIVGFGMGFGPKNREMPLLLVSYDDGIDGTKVRKEYHALKEVSRGKINGASWPMQFVKTEDKFLQKAPKVTYNNMDGISTLILFDPDAPERAGDDKHGTFGPYLHWLVTDIGVSSDGGQKAGTGKEVCPYMGPAPPRGKHRYIFLECKQEGTVKTPASIDDNGRAKWDLKGFLDANKDVLTPVSLNFYYCSVDVDTALFSEPDPPKPDKYLPQSSTSPEWAKAVSRKKQAEAEKAAAA